MAARRLVVHIGVGEVRAGLWCVTCALPSQYEADVFMLTATGVERVGVYTGCTEAVHG
jgi:hypothetical protein